MNSDTMWPLVANVSLLFTELPLLERPRAAREAGFDGIEMWWPFPEATPGPAAVDELLRAIDDAGIALRGLNLWAGDMPDGERGVISDPERRPQFESNLELVASIARHTGCRMFNALYGQRRPGLAAQDQDETAVANLLTATETLGAFGGVVLVEPLSRGLNGDYPIETASDARAVIERVRRRGGTSIGLLFDTFHLTNNGDDLLAVIERYGEVIAHVQLADTPGRGAPGTGIVDFVAVLDALHARGYRGAVACEYVPGDDTVASLGWVGAAPHLELGRA